MSSEPLNINSYDLLFVTAAEMPLTTNLQASQVLESAILMTRMGHRVSWISAVPALSYWKDRLFQLGKLNSVIKRCATEGIAFNYVVVPLSMSSPFAFMLRVPILEWAAGKLAKQIRSQASGGMGRPMIFHARSYYAAHLSIEMKSRLQSNNNCFVSFDMRSVLSDEFPLVLKRFGRLLYGYAKEWEFFLLTKSDVSFLPLDYAREAILAETGVQVTYVPIQGFDREYGWMINFEERWTSHNVGFAGSVGHWNDPLLLKEMIHSIPSATARLATEAMPELAELECKSYLYSEMKNYYDGLLALVIPGRVGSCDRFVRNNMRNGYFSTKATEALSRGVPLIVSSELRELAEFVKKHQCGAVYDVDEHKYIYPKGDWLDDKEVWMRITANAASVGAGFTRSAVLNRYRETWSELVVHSIKNIT
jgi:hypothetical protein